MCKDIPDEMRKKNMGTFFKSIHGTLNHLLLGDRLWMGRFTGTAFPIKSPDQSLYSDFSELWTAREETDIAINSWITSLSISDLDEIIDATEK